jgi:hypothetical protein
MSAPRDSYQRSSCNQHQLQSTYIKAEQASFICSLLILPAFLCTKKNDHEHCLCSSQTANFRASCQRTSHNAILRMGGEDPVRPSIHSARRLHHHDVRRRRSRRCKRKLKLAQNKSFEDDIHIAGHSSRESVAKQHLVQKAKEHIEGLREKGTKVEVNTKKKIEEVDELDSYRYLARAKRTLEDGAVAVRTKYWWEVVIVPLERTEVEARV